MPLTIERESLRALSRGFSLFGSGGGGAPDYVELMLNTRPNWPVNVASVDELPPETPCFAPAVAGSTLLFSERLPTASAFAPLIATAERWLGMRIPAVCSAEGGGMNGLVPLLFSPERTVVDADCSGRAVPSLDQFSLMVDKLPGLVVVADTGAGGIMLLVAERPADIEKMVRAAVIQAGGVGHVLLAGFTVGDLRQHAIPGHLQRAQRLGTRSLEFLHEAPEDKAVALGARFLGSGRITASRQQPDDEHVRTVRIAGENGEVYRLVSRSELLAFIHDGEVVAAAPECIVAVDPLTNEALQTTSLAINQKIEVYGIPVDSWWYSEPHRHSRVSPAEYGLSGLVPTAKQQTSEASNVR